MFLKRDSGGDLIIAARHPRWSLTWAWILTWRRKRPGSGERRWLFAAIRTNRFERDKPRRGLYGTLFLGPLRFERQPTMKLTHNA